MTRFNRCHIQYITRGVVLLCGLVQLVGLVYLNPANASDPSALKGGVNDEGRLLPSVKLTVPAPSAPRPHLESNVKQFSGSTPYSPGQSAPPQPRFVPPRPIIHQANINDSYRRTVFAPQRPPPPARWDYTMTPKNGVMTWRPGFEIKNVTSLRTPPRRTILNVSSLNSHLLNTNASISNQNLSGRPLGGTHSSVASRLVTPPELKATAFVLPQAKSAWLHRTKTWDEWYKRVAKAVYDQWQQSDTQAGVATVRVKVYQSHDVDCEIAEFKPAADLKREGKSEVSFREAAVRSVDGLNRSQVWEFPDLSPLPKEVIIDLELKRKVGGAAGCTVTRARNAG